MNKDESDRPQGIPEDYNPIMIKAKDGSPLLIWGRGIESETPDGRKKLTIEGFIPE